MAEQNEGVKTFVPGGAIDQYALVKLASGVVTETAATEQPIGVAMRAAAATDPSVPVKLLCAGGTIKCIADDAITQGAVVYCDGNGEVDDTDPGSALKVGVALDAATTAGDIIEVAPYVCHT